MSRAFTEEDKGRRRDVEGIRQADGRGTTYNDDDDDDEEVSVNDDTAEKRWIVDSNE